MQTGLLLTQEKNLQFLVRHIWNYQCYLMDSVDDFFFSLNIQFYYEKKKFYLQLLYKPLKDCKKRHL